MDQLLNPLHPGKSKSQSKSSLAGDSIRDFGLAEAERLIGCLAPERGLPLAPGKLAALPKGNPRKVICAALVKSQTAVPNEWLATRLAICHPVSMSKHVHTLPRDTAGIKTVRKYEKTLKPKD